MSVSSISSSFADYNVQQAPNKADAVARTFKQLGEDLQSGNPSAIQSDVATLRSLVPKLRADPAQNADPRVLAFRVLEQDLRSGNIVAARQAYAELSSLVMPQSE